MGTIARRGLPKTAGRLVLAAAGMLLLAGAVRPVAAQATATLNDLRWIAGEWRLEAEGRVTIEHWLEPASNAILATSRTLAGDRLVFFEFLRIEQRRGEIVYVAQPRGAAPTEFRLTSWDGKTAIFENPSHDFPKRILYTRRDDGGMTARIDGGAGVSQAAQEFPFQRVR